MRIIPNSAVRFLFSAMQHDLMLIKDLGPTPFGPCIIPMMSFFWISVMNRESWSGEENHARGLSEEKYAQSSF